MYHPTTIDDLLRIVDTERQALVAAAVIPNLAGDEALVRIRAEDERPPYFDHDEAKFRKRAPTIGGVSNLRRVRKIKTTYRTNDHDVPLRFEVEPTPHSIRRYTLGAEAVDVVCPTDDQYDFDDTDQAFLSDFGFEPAAVDAVHMGVYRTDDTFERKPSFPA